MAIVRPDCSVEAPPVVILAFEAVVAPPSAANTGSVRDSVEARAKAAAAVPTAAMRPKDCSGSSTAVVVDDVWVEAALRLVANRGESVEVCTDANPLAHPTTATRTDPAPKIGWDAFIVDCCVASL